MTKTKSKPKSDKNDTTTESDDSVKRLDVIIAILMNQNTVTEYNQTEKIFFLTKLGLKNKEIASILGTTLGTVEASKYGKKTSKQAKLDKKEDDPIE